MSLDDVSDLLMSVSSALTCCLEMMSLELSDTCCASPLTTIDVPKTQSIPVHGQILWPFLGRMKRVTMHIPSGMPVCLEFIMCVSCIPANFPSLSSCKLCNFCTFSGLVIMSSIGVGGKPAICIALLSLMGIQNLSASWTQHMSSEQHTLFRHLPFVKQRASWVHPKLRTVRLMAMKTGTSIMFPCNYSILISFSVVWFT